MHPDPNMHSLYPDFVHMQSYRYEHNLKTHYSSYTFPMPTHATTNSRYYNLFNNVSRLSSLKPTQSTTNVCTKFLPTSDKHSTFLLLSDFKHNCLSKTTIVMHQITSNSNKYRLTSKEHVPTFKFPA